MRQQGLIFDNISVIAIQDDHLSFLAVIIFLVIDAVLYFAATWYIEGVYPGRYGVAKPWYFPFMPSYWCGQKCASGKLSGLARRTQVSLEEDQHELLCETFPTVEL